jgi:sugar lactone lactonase YvrE
MVCRTVGAELIADLLCMIGEGPVWDERRHRLIWVDVAAGLIHSFDPGTRAVATRQAGQPVGSVALCAGAGLVAALRDGFGLLADGGGAMSAFLEVEKDRTGSRMNDGKCDSRGRFWAGSMAVDHTPGAGTLYRVDYANGGLRAFAQLRGTTISNGLDWSGDNARMYYVDSATQRIDMFDFDVDAGQLDNRRAFVVIPHSDGLPDGMTVDAEGYIWVALFGAGKVRRYNPMGEIDMEVGVPVTLVTSCAFGGEDLRDLYITTARHRLSAAEAAAQPTAGGVFACRPGPQGRAPFLFADRGWVEAA